VVAVRLLAPDAAALLLATVVAADAVVVVDVAVAVVLPAPLLQIHADPQLLQLVPFAARFGFLTS
jgi:hypothetical protein